MNQVPSIIPENIFLSLYLSIFYLSSIYLPRLLLSYRKESVMSVRKESVIQSSSTTSSSHKTSTVTAYGETDLDQVRGVRAFYVWPELLAS